MYYNIQALICTSVSNLIQATNINIYLYTDLQSTLDISKSKRIAHY